MSSVPPPSFPFAPNYENDYWKANDRSVRNYYRHEPNPMIFVKQHFRKWPDRYKRPEPLKGLDKKKHRDFGKRIEQLPEGLFLKPEKTV